MKAWLGFRKAWYSPALLVLLGLGGCAGISSKSTTGAGGQGGGPPVIDAAIDTTHDAGAPDIGSATDASCDGPPGSCKPCGNGVLNPPAETCDDGNQTGGDGCSPDCKTETDWICPTPGQPCIYTVACGDGMVAGAETCDDHNTKAGDGCDGELPARAGLDLPAGRAPAASHAAATA